MTAPPSSEAGPDITVGLVDGMLLAELQIALEAGKPLRLAEAVGADREARARAVAWSLVHFLFADPVRRDAFLAFAREVANAETPPDTEDMERLLRAGLGLPTDADVERFQREWEAHVRGLEPTTAHDLLLAAEAYRRHGDPAKAAALCRAAVERDPAAAAPRRGLAAVTEGEAQLEALRAVLARDPLDVASRRRLGLALEAAGEGAEAEREAALAQALAAALSPQEG